VKLVKVGFGETLGGGVVSAGGCVGCAACVVSCPFNCLDYVEEKPVEARECRVCGICPLVCPRYGVSRPALEEFVFGRKSKPGEEFGVYRRVAVARARDGEVLRVCQDGGVVTALLAFALEEGLIDGAAVSGTDAGRPLYPVPRLATSRREVLDSAGTRYSYSPNLLALQEGVKLGRGSLAFVGTPCQVLALRRMQMVPLSRYVRSLGLAVGLMCTEAFTYSGLVEGKIRGEMGIDPGEVEKVNIKAKLLVTTRSRGEVAIPLSEAKRHAREACSPCTDFSAELADISCGGVGLRGWTLTILRTEKGEEAFDSAEEGGALETRPVEQERKALETLIKLSKMKHLRESRG